jgi:chromosome segregation ATPase
MATRKSSKVRRGGASSELRAIGVMVENLQSQMRVVVEAVTGTRTSLEASMSAMEARLIARIEILEQVVRKNSEDIRKNSEDIRKNSEDIKELREEVARLRHDFDHRHELARIDDLEGRVSALERRVSAAR